MTQQEIIDGNKIIAEFYGAENIVEIQDWLNFHSDWNWLMSVCKKWDSLGEEDDLFSRDNLYLDENYMVFSDDLDNYVILYEIEPVFKQLVKNIKWYNSEKEKRK